MIILDVKLDGILGFNDFSLNLSYPKKIVNSFIEDEYLKGRERFRYKKAIILMGANATGKTSLARALHSILDFIQSGGKTDIYKIASRDGATFSIDFVVDDHILHRLKGKFLNANHVLSFVEERAVIDKNDSYEKCVEKLEVYHREQKTSSFFPGLDDKLQYRFSYPDMGSIVDSKAIKKKYLLKTLKAVIGTLDPSLKNVSIAKDLRNSFIIRRDNQEIIIQDGKLLNREVLSSGTIEGIDIAVFLASMMENKPCFYYCDEHFSYIHSDLEKRFFGIMLEHIPQNGQLLFTTHNTDMLDLNLPKHSYVFLRKKEEDGIFKVSAVSASDIIKRNTDSTRNAVENDMFASLPDDSLLDELEKEWPDNGR